MSLKYFSARLAGAMALFAALSAMAGSAQAQAQLPPISHSDDDPNGNSLLDSLFDRQSNWKEIPVAALPPLPSDANLLPFSLQRPTSLKYMIDSKSISIGKDGVVRYTVVIDSPDGGARNIRYEGIHCASYRWRLYSGANSDGTAWDNASTPWARIENSQLNGYQSELYNSYFCDNKEPVRRVATIVDYIRYGRTLRDNDYRD